jgi:hypothetical protein
MSKLDDEFGISDKDIDKLMKEADEQSGALSNLTPEELEQIQKQREKAQEVRNTLKDTRGMANKNWAEAIIKSSIENAVVAQHLAVHDLEDNFESKKITSMSELTNAITSGASELVKMDNQERHLEIAQEKNDLRRLESTGGKIIDTNSNGEPIEAIGKGKDLLKLIKAQDDEEIDINTGEQEQSDESDETS